MKETIKNKVSDDVFEETIKEFMPFIDSTAYQLRLSLPSYMTTDDLKVIGAFGLFDALTRFKPGKNKLNSYAELRIRGAMIDEIRKASWIPRTTRKKIYVINKAREQLEKESGKKIEEWKVAESLKIPFNEYARLLQFAIAEKIVRMEDFKANKHEDSELTIGEAVAGDDKDALDIMTLREDKEKIIKVIKTLPAKEQLILVLYYKEELTLAEIGKVLHVTESRVSQLRRDIILRLKELLKPMLT